MIWITKYRHNKIVGQYEDAIKSLNEALYRKEKFEEIVDKLADKTNVMSADLSGAISSTDVMAHLDDSVPRYVEDVNGGKVIKQEATPVTILDENGKATYGLTKEKPDKGRMYQLKFKQPE